jgi:hypothetical protein
VWGAEKSLLKACTDRLIVGGLDPAKKPVVAFIEFQRLLSGDGGTRYSYRVWLSREGKIALTTDETWTGKGDPCELPTGKTIKVSKPEGTHFLAETPLEGGGEFYVATMAPRNTGSRAYPVGKGFVRFSAASAIMKINGAFIRAGAAWLESEYAWKDSGAVPTEWTVAFTPELGMWMVVRGGTIHGFSSFTDDAGETRFGRDQSYQEVSSEIEADSQIPFPRVALHTLPWAKAKLDLRFTQKWLEPSGEDKANGLVAGFGSCRDPFKHIHTLTTAAWIRQRGPMQVNKKR